MKLAYLIIKNYRRIQEATIRFGDATFLIGENNVGKSSVLNALDLFFSEDKAHPEDFFKADDDNKSDEIVLEAKFTEVPEDALTWRGFRGRVHTETVEGSTTRSIYYRKTYKGSGPAIREMKSFDVQLKEQFKACRSIDDFVSEGASRETLTSLFPDADPTKNLTAKEKEKLYDIDELFDVLTGESKWVPNPGGIEGNITVRLPKYLLIPAESRKEEIDSSSGVLHRTMNELFEEVRELSDNFKKAQEYLNALSKELDPEDESMEFGKMLREVNNIISGVFQQSQLHISANLSDPTKVVKPSFDIEMSSNVRTKLERQGTGSVRSAAFALLRYREKFLQRKLEEGTPVRDLIIGFEEPEMYLHPNAANLMRDKLYELAVSTYSNIVCTTHSPYMIDLSKKIDVAERPTQVLNLFRLEQNAGGECCRVFSLNTTEGYENLQADDKSHVKFLLKIDDTVARIFFSKNIIVIEGDTEEILFKETVARLESRKREAFFSTFQVVKARGKATIISLVKYLKILGINPFVIHDEDVDEGATRFNQPILEALENDETKRLMVRNTIEDLLGYPAPASEKPYRAYAHIRDTWGRDWQGVPETWRRLFETRIAPSLFPATSA